MIPMKSMRTSLDEPGNLPPIKAITKPQSPLQILWRNTAFTLYFRLHNLSLSSTVFDLKLNRKAGNAVIIYNIAVNELREALRESYEENKATYKRNKR